MYVFLHIFGWLLAKFPAKVTLACAAFLGWIWYTLIPIRSKVARQNLQRAFPELSCAQQKKIVRKCFFHWTLSALELLRLTWLPLDRLDRNIVRVGIENFENAQAQKRGVVAVTAHMGNFELMALAEALRGVLLHVVTREPKQRGVRRWFYRLRFRFGLHSVSPRHSAIKIRKLLKQQNFVALVIDQHMPAHHGILVPFFGSPASTTFAPALLALTCAAPILPVTICRLKNGLHQIQYDPIVQPDPAKDRKHEIMRVTTELNQWLEAKIQKHPEQWLWFHRRWKDENKSEKAESMVGKEN